MRLEDEDFSRQEQGQYHKYHEQGCVATVAVRDV